MAGPSVAGPLVAGPLVAGPLVVGTLNEPTGCGLRAPLGQPFLAYRQSKTRPARSPAIGLLNPGGDGARS